MQHKEVSIEEWSAILTDYSNRYEARMHELAQAREVHNRLLLQAEQLRSGNAVNPDHDVREWSKRRSQEAVDLLKNKHKAELFLVEEAYERMKVEQGRVLLQWDEYLGKLRDHVSKVLDRLDNMSNQLSTPTNAAAHISDSSGSESQMHEETLLTTDDTGTGVDEHREGDLKLSYLEGKRSGSNIYDRKGNLIIVKNQRITRELIKTAEDSNRLGDLIINMLN